MKDDLISRKALLDVVGKMPQSWEYGQAVSDIYNIIKSMPAIDLEKLMPKERAMWIPHYNGGIDRREYRCSKCWTGAPTNQEARCPGCGSEMLPAL